MSTNPNRWSYKWCQDELVWCFIGFIILLVGVIILSNYQTTQTLVKPCKNRGGVIIQTFNPKHMSCMKADVLIPLD